MGFTPTGKNLTVDMVDIFGIVKDKIAEYWDIINRLDFLLQIGAIEYTKKGKQLFNINTK